MRLAPFALLIAILGLSAALPAFARTGMLQSENSANECPDVAAAVGEADAESATPVKPAAAKRNAAPTPSKSRPAPRGNTAPPVRSPRWHRFLPGMFR